MPKLPPIHRTFGDRNRGPGRTGMYYIVYLITDSIFCLHYGHGILNTLEGPGKSLSDLGQFMILSCWHILPLKVIVPEAIIAEKAM
jgi:hypothetical protein